MSAAGAVTPSTASARTPEQIQAEADAMQWIRDNADVVRRYRESRRAQIEEAARQQQERRRGRKGQSTS